MYERLRFEILRLAVEKRRPVRWKDLFPLVRRRIRPLSTKTVSKCLKRMIEEGYVDRVISEVTKKPAYKITLNGLEEYSLNVAIQIMNDSLTEMMKAEDHSYSTEMLIVYYELTTERICEHFLWFIPKIKKMVDKRDETLTMIANITGKIFAQSCKIFADRLLSRNDVDEKIRTRTSGTYSHQYDEIKRLLTTQLEEARNKWSKTLNDLDEEMKKHQI